MGLSLLFASLLPFSLIFFAIAVNAEALEAEIRTTEAAVTATTEATNDPLTQAETIEQAVLEEIVIEPRADRSKQWLVDRIDDLSEGLDVFFVQYFFNEEVFEDDIGGNRAVIAIDSRREIGGDVTYKLTGKLKLELPNTNKRMKLLVSSEDDSEYEINKQPIQNIQNASYSTAVRFILNERSAWQSDIDVGFRGGLPLNPYSRFRARRYGDSFGWQHRFTQSFYYRYIDGWGETTELRYDKNIFKGNLVVFNTEADYLIKNDYFDIKSDITLYHKIDETAVAAYHIGVVGDTDKGAIISSYYTGVKYRKLIYKDWVYASVTPQIEWNRDREYRRMWVLMFNFEAILSSELN